MKSVIESLVRNLKKRKIKNHSVGLRRYIVMVYQKISNLLYDFVADLRAGTPTSKLVEIYTDKIIQLFRETSDQKPS